MATADHLNIDHSRNPDVKDLGTGSPRALGLARAWLNNCVTQHKICNKGGNERPLLPTRVIDVGNDNTEPRLIAGANRRDSYCALSYCWGVAQTLTTTKSTLKQHEALIPFDLIPQR